MTVQSTVNILVLQAQLEMIEKQIAETKKAAKLEKKLRAMKLNHRTSHKYFDLQAAYMQAVRGV